MQKKLLCATFLIFCLTKKVGRNSNSSLPYIHILYIIHIIIYDIIIYINIYIYIYIHIHEYQKKTKEIYVPSPGSSNSKEENYTKLKIANSIQYKPQKRYKLSINSFHVILNNYYLSANNLIC